MHRRIIAALVACGLVVGVAACGSGSNDNGGSAAGGSASGSGSITVAAFGGTYGDAEKAAYFDPFTKATGIKVNILQAEPTLGAVKLQVEKNNVVWDIAELPGPDQVTACDQGLIEHVDYKLVKKADLAPQGGYTCGVLASLFAEGIGYNTEQFKTPPRWQDFFNTAKYPGRRTMEKYLTDGALEYGLLADGVPKDGLYPLDLDRAVKKLETLGNDLVLVDSLAQASQLLTSGDAVMIQTAAGRILPLKNAGLPVDFAPIGELAVTAFTIPKGAKNSENAMKFLAFIASCASCSQQMARLTTYSGPNKDGSKGLPDAIKDALPDSPAVTSQAFVQDNEWWSQNAAKAQEAFDRFLNE